MKLDVRQAKKWIRSLKDEIAKLSPADRKKLLSLWRQTK